MEEWFVDETYTEPGSEAAKEPAWQRALFMIGFWFLGNIAFSLSILLGAVQFVVVLVTGNKNEELGRFSGRLIAYVWECLAYITYRQDEKPFPFGKFPEEKE